MRHLPASPSRWIQLRRLAATCIALWSIATPLVGAKVQSQVDYTRNVDPFIGVDWGGNTFVGSAIPYGVVKVGPDMQTFDGRRSGFGYSSSGVILGFSHLHLSGAQGKYGNILVAPVTGPLDLNDIKTPRTDEVNRVGYYAAKLTRYQVQAELTSSRRVGFHRYTFPASQQSHITINVASALSLGTDWQAQKFLGAEVHLTSNHEVQGVARFTGGWNRGGEYKVYYYMTLDTPANATHTWSGKDLTTAQDVTVGANTPVGASFDFATKANQVIQAKVGISFISAEQAKHNVQQEVPAWNFATVRNAATGLWNSELAKLSLSGESDSQRRQLYTAMYHIMLMPTDRTGENPDWQSSEPYYDDFYCIWDTFRTSSPLLTLISPDRQRDILRALIDIYRHTGYMPDARSGNDNGRTQGGSNANVVVADAWVKGLKGIDYETAFAAMVHDAEVPPTDQQKEGRGGLKDYNEKGFVTLADERSGSRTAEYSYDDFAISEVACGLGKAKEAALYASRAHNFEHLWDKDMSVEGFKGFMRPRNPDGSWAPPYLVVRGTWPDFFYEGDIWTYSIYAPQDMRRLIEMAGGNEAFAHRLDWTFLRRHFDVTNEPGFLLPVLYNYAGRPDKTADIVHMTLEKAFADNRAGIPGNDDSGAMSSWLIFSTLGLFPIAGQDVYLISTPSIPDASLSLGNGKKLRILSKNLDPDGLNRYVQSATLNGVDLPNSWFRHAQIKDGATLILTMGSAPSDWGKLIPPPSMSDTTSPVCSKVQSGTPSM
ncbi:GH92 family glycosyl hydrolase [Terriglobus saanensis]|uniref:Alpha-1,2-mannosidase n=1 Tax=Terriglobus saanensis (strain ATCC BAA-1853 / DSM 23119 / SP1PR4) TaxID=401053 RepID=E8UWX4_TERSS|nr:GH92 family glycosyl hydrolase [Terriglobus saanensis]ADV81861.1 alpha-1,2-mannosidase [Terriglobus saanensis SP1PR4]